MVCGPTTPEVSIGTGVKAWAELRPVYFFIFLSSAKTATAPAALVAAAEYEVTKVSGQVVSQTCPLHNYLTNKLSVL